MSSTDDNKPTESDWAALRAKQEYDLGSAPLSIRERGALRMVLIEKERNKWLRKKIITSTTWLAGLLSGGAVIVQFLQGLLGGHK